MSTLRRQARTLAHKQRRHFLHGCAKGLLGVGAIMGGAMAGLPASEPNRVHRRPTARKAIYLFMSGGMSHLDTFDLKPGASVQGPVKAIPTTADGLQISEYFPALAKQMREVAIINSLNSNQGAHEPGQYFMHTSFSPRGTIRHPAMGAWCSQGLGRLNDHLPGNITIGTGSRHPGAGYLEARHAPVPVADASAGLPHVQLPAGIEQNRFKRRVSLLQGFNNSFKERYANRQVDAYHELFDEAVGLMNSKELGAFDLSSEDAATRAAYGDNAFGQGCLLARRLVEHDVRYVEVELGGWDTHVDNHNRTQEQAAILDQALATLLHDLRRRGLLEETLVILATEFGRSPIMNGNRGRDHHPSAFSGLLAGGGITGGRRYGQTDERGMSVVNQIVTVADFNATIAYGLGLDWQRQFTSPGGRPFTIADKGQPVFELFA